MHFITLVAVEVGDYPICKIADARINAEIAALSKIKAVGVDGDRRACFRDCGGYS